MSTFLCDLQLNKTLQSDKNRNNQTKRSQCQQTLSLTQRGLNQAHRNDSTSMWKLINNWDEQTQAGSCNQLSVRLYDYVNEEEQKSFKRSERRAIQTLNNSQHAPQVNSSRKSQSGQNQANNRKKQVVSKSKLQKRKQSVQKAKKTFSIQKTSNINADLKQVQSPKYENLDKMNQQIKKHLERQRFATRNLSNSAFAKLYNRPCVQSYGYGNTSKQSQAANNLLKTHNITPHTKDNNPSVYQSYQTALHFAKRTRIDDEDKQQRLRRQFLRWFDDSVVEAAQSQLQKKNHERKAKSEQKTRKRYEELQRIGNLQNQEVVKQKLSKRRSLKQLLGNKEPAFVYRRQNKDGSVCLSKDRHGLTCYVDSGFLANNQALVNFHKNQRPIYPEKVKEQDMNIDSTRKNNHNKSLQECHPGHYMVPCVVTPYDKNKYQFRKKRAQSTIN